MADEKNNQIEIEAKFAGLVQRYFEDPTLKNYLVLRENFPDRKFDADGAVGLEWLMVNSRNLSSLGLDPAIIAGAMDADIKCVNQLSLQLIRLVVKRQEKEEEGEAHLKSREDVIGDSLLSYIICIMLDALSCKANQSIPNDLIVLVKHVLKADVSFQTTSTESSMKKLYAMNLAVQLKLEGKVPTIRALAKEMEVNPSSVSRWLRGIDIEKEVDRRITVNKALSQVAREWWKYI